MNLQLVRNGRAPTSTADAEAALAEATAGWTPATLIEYISSGEIPTEYVERVVAMIRASPVLVRVEKHEFLTLVGKVRPDLAGLLATAPGDAWLERCLGHVRAALVMGAVSPLFRLLRGG